MMQVINTNTLSLIAQNNLNKSQATLGTAIERLSSGRRINSAKDDAAGQAISNRFSAKINGLTQAARNANDGTSIAQTTEGALNEVNDNLQKIRTLTVQAKNGTNTDSDKQSIQDEIKQRLAEIDRISEQTEFNGIKVLSKDQSLSIQVGADDKQTIDIELKKMDSAELKMDDYDVTGADTDTLLATVDAALSTVSSLRSGLGAVQNRFDSVVNTLNSTVVNLTASQSRIQDADMATEVSNMSKGNMLQQAGTAVLAQANQSPQNILSLLR
ncbi:flagellin N-terminal helical domain-containing protein [Pantoea anthophila]|uniref:flagellin N-terminal helical domain-containing protein n=1 Tax=Pantoea anthophila TaxID=470931 RepID=UPI002DB7983D|nr:flagellin [Pantoea anthophila]MEB5707579.1 flagellin FliC [Pantoea anthophila]MEB6518450.1 flagellin FliC [Pantoea anthophila]